MDLHEMRTEHEQMQAEARRQRIRDRQYTAAMIRHGDCRDPDHPGCPNCEEFDDEE